MTTRQTNRLLMSTAITLGVAALAIVAAGVLVPIDSTDRYASRPADATFAPTPATQPAGLERLFARAFRTALDDGPAPNAKTVAQADPVGGTSPVQMTLIGTIGNSLAMLRLADGSVVARGVGEQIDGAEIIRIDAASVGFRRGGQQFSVAKPPADTSMGPIIIR